MHKLILAFTLLFSSADVRYANVEYVECYNNINKKIELIFGFDCDYVEAHSMVVDLDIYDSNDIMVASYNNAIKVIGKKEAKATIDYLYKEGLKVDVTITYNEQKLIDHIRLELVVNDVCYMGESDRNCSVPYKSGYKDDVVSRYESNFKILYLPFDSFLVDNSLNVEDIIIYSECDISDAEIYLYTVEEIDGYKLVYDEGYRFLLGTKKENNHYSFYLLEEHYLLLPEFSFSDVYDESGIATRKIYFPYLEEQKEYDFLLVIKGKIQVEISFSLFTSDKLYGDCSDSKYCLEVNQYA